jgi:hypothetical protein
MRVSERIMTLHPSGKRGSNITKARYDVVAQKIVKSIAAAGVLPFKDLAAQVEARLSAQLDGAIGWYTTTVKLDLEARGVIKRVSGSSPQQLRLRHRNNS